MKFTFIVHVVPGGRGGSGGTVWYHLVQCCITSVNWNDFDGVVYNSLFKCATLISSSSTNIGKSVYL